MGRYCSYLLLKHEGGTFQIEVNPTQVRKEMPHHVEVLSCFTESDHFSASAFQEIIAACESSLMRWRWAALPYEGRTARTRRSRNRPSTPPRPLEWPRCSLVRRKPPSSRPPPPHSGRGPFGDWAACSRPPSYPPPPWDCDKAIPQLIMIAPILSQFQQV